MTVHAKKENKPVMEINLPLEDGFDMLRGVREQLDTLLDLMNRTAISDKEMRLIADALLFNNLERLKEAEAELARGTGHKLKPDDNLVYFPA